LLLFNLLFTIKKFTIKKRRYYRRLVYWLQFLTRETLVIVCVYMYPYSTLSRRIRNR